MTRLMVLSLVAAGLFVTAGLLVPALVLGFDPCGNEHIQTAISPDGNLKATVFSRNCGATTPYSVHVFLGGIDDKPDEAGNVFRGTHSNEISVEWVGNDTLRIRTLAKTFLLMKQYGDTTFEKVEAKP